MTEKTRVTERLASLNAIEGLLPTPPSQSETLKELAQQLRSNDLSGAESSTIAQLDRSQIDVAVRSPAPELFGGPELREQVAGFADAGLNFFHAEEEFWRLDPAHRIARGGRARLSEFDRDG